MKERLALVGITAIGWLLFILAIAVTLWFLVAIFAIGVVSANFFVGKKFSLVVRHAYSGLAWLLLATAGVVDCWDESWRRKPLKDYFVPRHD